MTLDQIREAASGSVNVLIARLETAAESFAHAVASGSVGGESALSGVAIGIGVAREVLHVALTGEFPADDDVPDSEDAAELAGIYRAAIDSCIAHVQAADPAAFLDVRWVHPRLGDLNWHEWLAFLALDAEERACG